MTIQKRELAIRFMEGDNELEYMDAIRLRRLHDEAKKLAYEYGEVLGLSPFPEETNCSVHTIPKRQFVTCQACLGDDIPCHNCKGMRITPKNLTHPKRGFGYDPDLDW